MWNDFGSSAVWKRSFQKGGGRYPPLSLYGHFDTKKFCEADMEVKSLCFCGHECDKKALHTRYFVVRHVTLFCLTRLVDLKCTVEELSCLLSRLNHTFSYCWGVVDRSNRPNRPKKCWQKRVILPPYPPRKTFWCQSALRWEGGTPPLFFEIWR